MDYMIDLGINILIPLEKKNGVTHVQLVVTCGPWVVHHCLAKLILMILLFLNQNLTLTENSLIP